MKIKLSLLVLIIGSLFLFVGLSLPHAQGIDLGKILPSAETLLSSMEESAHLTPLRVFNDKGRAGYTFYVPANPGSGNWSNPLRTLENVRPPFKGNQPIRSGLILPVIEHYRSYLLQTNNGIIDPTNDEQINAPDVNVTSHYNEVINSLKAVCDQQCEEEDFYKKFQKCENKQGACGKDDPPEACTCRLGHAGPGDCNAGFGPCISYSKQELINLCKEFECGVKSECREVNPGDPADCDIIPINQAFYQRGDSANAEFRKWAEYRWAKNAYQTCVHNNPPLDMYHPTWCTEENISSQPYNPDDYKQEAKCDNDDRKMMCFYQQGTMPRLTKASVDGAAYLQKLFASLENQSSGPFADLINQLKDQLKEIFTSPDNLLLPPINVGGAYRWSKTPEEIKEINEEDYCINKSSNSCSCGHILPFNGSTITVAGLRRKLLEFGVPDANKYCLNTADNLSCQHSYSWDVASDSGEQRNTKVGMRNLYASRAAFPGWINHRGEYIHGATCSKRPKGSSIGGSESGSKTRTFQPTDKEFFFVQSRYFADKSVNTGKSYGGCDDRSNILYNHATAAHCQRKSKHGIKCRSGSRRFSSFACDVNGGVINQCNGKSVSGGHNVICQICGPIYCGERGLYSDTNTVRKSIALDNKPTRHYKFDRYAHPEGDTSKYGKGGTEGGITQDGNEKFFSYESLVCQGDACDDSYDDAVFAKRDFGEYALAGNVFDDRTCPDGYIVDPCSQQAITNNWGGHRLCYESCCVSSDGKQCDHYVGKCPAGECCEKTIPDGNACRTSTNQYGYGNELCSIDGDTDKVVQGLSIIKGAQPSPEKICEAAGRQDALYTDTVGGGYTFDLQGNSQCYFCGCRSITMNHKSSTGITPLPSSGWWPNNSTIKGADEQCRTPLEHCAYAFNHRDPNTGRPIMGFDGLAQARDRFSHNPLIAAIESKSNKKIMKRLVCVRCRCVDGDGICDGCDNDPNGKCNNFPHFPGGLDPDCGGECPTTPTPSNPCGSHNCRGTCGACPPKDGYIVTSYPYGGNAHPQCSRCVYKALNCNNNGICDGSETCETCPSECGECKPLDKDCPDGYSRLCPGDGYPDLAKCKRCYDPKKPNEERHGCKNDGYCNPLCDSKDEDCEIDKTTEMIGNQGCPIGYGSSGRDECKSGDQHPIMSGCFSCNQCDSKGLSCPDDPDGISWKVVTLAQQQQIYQGSHCYGYQFFNAKEVNPYIPIGADMHYYDYQQRNAWMSNDDGKDFDQLDAKGGYRRCRPVRKPLGTNNGIVGDCEYRCIPAMHELIVLSCSEIDARFPHEYGTQPLDTNSIFIPDIARSAGNERVIAGSTSEGLSYVPRSSDARCGRYYRVYPKSNVVGDLNGDGKKDWRDGNATASYLFTNWWQIGGNAYGQRGISNYGDGKWQVADPSADTFARNPATKHLVNPSFQYALNDGQCLVSGGSIADGNYQPTIAPTLGSGLQVSGGEVTKIAHLRTYRGDKKVNQLSAESGYKFSTKLQRVLDYDYYSSLLQNMPGSGGCLPVKTGTGSNEEITEVCYYLGNQSYKRLKTKIDHMDGGKRVIFIDGDFTLDDNMPVGGGGDTGYLALIIKGDFIIEPEVGYYLTKNEGQACEVDTVNLCQPAFNAVVVARSLGMKKSSAMIPDRLFNPLITCDKRLVLKGAYAFWGNQPVVFTRSLLGCGFKKGPFPNGNASLNTHDGERTGENFDGRRAGLNNKNAHDDYCRTGKATRNGNGYYNYKAGGESAGMYNNYNRLFAATQIIANPQLIQLTPAWMRQNLSTRLEVR